MSQAFLGRPGIIEWRAESRVVIGLARGDYVYTKGFAGHLE